MIWEARQTGVSTNGGGFRGSALLAPPSTPAVAGSGTGGTVAANTYYCVVTYSGSGETGISAQQSVTLTGTTSSFVVTSPADPGLGGSAVWNLYVATASGGPYFPQGTGLVIGSNRTVTTTPPTTGTQPPGTDRSVQDGPQVNVENSAITATTAGANSNVLTFTLGYTPTGADVGNIFNATGGTNINTGRYEITAVTATTWTVTGATNLTTGGGAGSAITGKMGGAVDSPATIAGIVSSGQTVFVKYNATAYSLGSSANVSGGRISVTFGGTSYWQGYNTTRTLDNTDANRPILDAGAASITMVLFNNGPHYFKGFSFTNSAARASVTGISLGTSNVGQRLKLDGMTVSSVIMNGTGARVIDSESVNFAGSSAQFSVTQTGGALLRCHTGPPASGASVAFQINAGGAIAEQCVADRSSGVGFSFGAALGATARHCTAYNCSSHGFSLQNDSQAEWCLAYGSGSAGTVYGFALTGVGNQATLRSCAGGSNFTANYNTSAFWSSQVTGFVTLSGDPFTSAAGGDFSLNATAGAGAACKAISATLPGISTTLYEDIGAVQGTSVQLAQPATTDVRSGTAFGGGTGTLAVPAASDVRRTVAVDAATGTAYIPTAANVRSGVNVDATTGTLTLPAATNVKTGIGYGAAGTELTGTLSPTTTVNVVSAGLGAGLGPSQLG